MGFREGAGSEGGGVTFAPPSGQIDAGDANSEGASDFATRADHQHSFPGPTGAPPPLAVAGAAGASGRPARQDHTHTHTAAHHLGGGHADLTGDFADINAPGTAVGAHEGAGDPHPDYQLEAAALGAGDVVLQALADAKGDLVAATGADTWARLAVGADGTFLVADSSQAAGVKYAPGPEEGVTDHGALTGLADDDHPQYQLTTAAAKIVAGSYTGDGTVDRLIPLPFDPKWLVLFGNNGYSLSSLATNSTGWNSASGVTTDDRIRPDLAVGGFTVTTAGGGASNNTSGQFYRYVAFG